MGKHNCNYFQFLPKNCDFNSICQSITTLDRHWLPICQDMECKFCLLVHRVRHALRICQKDLHMVEGYKHTIGHLVVPSMRIKTVDMAFADAGLKVWNNLLAVLRLLTSIFLLLTTIYIGLLQSNTYIYDYSLKRIIAKHCSLDVIGI